MWKWLINYVLSRISVEQLVAYALSWLINQILANGKTAMYYAQAKVTLAKVEESVQLAQAVIEDDKVEPAEVTATRIQLLKIWGEGADSMTHRSVARVNHKRKGDYSPSLKGGASRN
jgi:hypothetical protein